MKILAAIIVIFFLIQSAYAAINNPGGAGLNPTHALLAQTGSCILAQTGSCLLVQ